jgi:hypothetical protein
MDFRERKLNRQCFRLALGLVTLGVAALHAAPADACSCSDSWTNELQVGQGLIPANAGGIPWWFPGGELISRVEEPRFRFDIEYDLEPLQAMVQLSKMEGDGYGPVAARVERYGHDRYLVRPEVPWSQGERYRLSVDPSRAPQAADAAPDIQSRVVEFEIGAALAGERYEPIELNVSELLQAELGFLDPTGPCGRDEPAAYVDIDFPVPAGAPEWPGPFLDYTTLVDGAVWSPRTNVCQELEPGASWVSRTGNRIAAPCDVAAADGTNSLYAGLFVVRMEASLPGSDVVVHSEEVEIEIACTGTSGGLGAVENDALPIAGASTAPDAASTAPDAVSHAGCSVAHANGTRHGFGRATLGFGSLLLAAAAWRARSGAKPARRSSRAASNRVQ